MRSVTSKLTQIEGVQYRTMSGFEASMVTMVTRVDSLEIEFFTKKMVF